MKFLMFDYPKMDEAGGEGGGGGTGGEGGTGGGEGSTQGGEGGGEGGDEPENELAKALDDGGEGGDKGKGGEPPKGGEPEKGGEGAGNTPPSAEETKAYKDALKLDEKVFGKDIGFDERYVEKLPAFFKKYGIDPAKANEMANEFAKMQRTVDEDVVKKANEFREWRAKEMQKLNEAFLEKYDKPGRQAIGRAIDRFFKKGTPMYDIVRRSEVGVDPGFLEAMAFIGERLPADDGHGGSGGAGAGTGKSISDSFMGE